MSVKAVGQASAHRTDSGSAASGGSGQQQSTMQISVASWVPPLSGDTAEAQFLKSLVTGGLLNRDPNQQIPLDHHVAEVQEEFGGLQRRSFSTTARLKQTILTATLTYIIGARPSSALHGATRYPC